VRLTPRASGTFGRIRPHDRIRTQRPREGILAAIKPLAIEYGHLTGKPLGVTGEIGEMEASVALGMTLEPARSPGVDALRDQERVQIKATRVPPGKKRLGRMSRISVSKPCDTIMLAVLDQNFDLHEVWEAAFDKVADELRRPGSKARERGQMAVSKFKNLARRTWTRDPERERLMPVGSSLITTFSTG
jgi:hypothetical protein